MRVHAQHVDLAVARAHSSTNLVERREHVSLRVAMHGSCDGEPRHLLDGDVQEDCTRVDARHAQLEHVEDKPVAYLWLGRVELCHRVLEGATSHLGRLTAATPLLREELDVVNSQLLLREGALELKVLDRDGERRMPIDGVLTPQKRHAGERLGLAHTHAVRNRRVHDVEVIRLQVREVALEARGKILRVLAAREDLVLPRRVRLGHDLQPPEV